MTLGNRPQITQDNIFSFLEESEAPMPEQAGCEGPMLEQEGCEGPMLEQEGCEGPLLEQEEVDKKIGRPGVFTPEKRRKIKNRSSLKS